MTAGDVNRVIVEDFNPPPTAGTFSPKLGLYQETSLSNMTPKNKPFKNVFGNCSRYATNWISGPTHEMCQQHIPGYIGHVPGLISENLYSKSYAKCTQAAIGRRMPRGHDVEAKVRFMSTQKLEYTDKNHRRIAENVDNRVIKDYADYSKYVNGQFSRQKETILTQTLQSEDQEATTIVTTSPKLKKSKLTQALNQLRMQTARHAQTMGRRNDTFRTVASTPKQRRISFAGDMEQTLSPTAELDTLGTE